MFLRQSTASQSRMVGPFVDDVDFKTLETGLTIANTDVKLSKNGAAGVDKNSGGGTHRNNGMYSLTFNATDTDTVGELTGSIAVSGALVVPFKFFVLEEVVYDALFNASAAAFDASHRVTVGSIAANVMNASALATDAVNEIRDAIFARAFSAAYNSLTFDELVKLMAAALYAKCSGMATATGTFRNLADSGNAIVATVDADGNRSAVTLTP